MANFNSLYNNGFGVVTVMNAWIVPLKSNYTYSELLTPGSFDTAKAIWLDTLKVSNLTQEGPTKTITGGQSADPLIKYGKTMTADIQDALGRFDVLERVMGVESVIKPASGSTSSKEYLGYRVGDKFPGAFAIQGETYFIDRKTGEQKTAYIFIPQYLPDSILDFTQDAEGDATVFSLAGSVCMTRIADSENASETEVPSWKVVEGSSRKVFYEVTADPYLSVAGEADAQVEAPGDALKRSNAPIEQEN